MGYGLGPAANGAFDGGGERRPISIIGDGGFWHNGLSSSIGNMVFNKSDGVAVVVDNYYSAATGGQDVMSSPRRQCHARPPRIPIAEAVKGIGVDWVRQIDRTYDVPKMRDTLREALTTPRKGPKVIVASSECMLNKQRREKPLKASRRDQGRPPGRGPRFGVDEAVCTGDHACMRLSGCPSLGLKHGWTIRCATIRSPHRPDLRRLRQLRRGGRCRRAVPQLLPRRCRPQPDRVRERFRHPRPRHRLAAAAAPPAGWSSRSA
jgi:indolepyruvate ferredoxin oxidoreductase alpha subunit